MADSIFEDLEHIVWLPFDLKNFTFATITNHFAEG
jgi:hypothetical protein